MRVTTESSIPVDPKVGIVTGGLMIQGGGEEVIRKIAVGLDADIYTLAYDPQRFDKGFRDDVNDRIVKIVNAGESDSEIQDLEDRFDEGFFLQETFISGSTDLMSRTNTDLIDADVLVAAEIGGQVISYSTGLPYVTYLHHPAKVFTDYFWDMISDEESIVKTAKRMMSRWSYTRTAKKSTAGSDKLFVNAERTRSRTNEVWNIPKEDMDLLYPPIDVDFFSGESPEDDILDLDRYFFAPQRLEAYKNIPLMVEAAKYANEHLVITGMGTLESYVRREAQYSRYIHALGYMDRESLRTLYHNATATLQGTLREDFGMVPVESMACGTPSLLPASGGFLETIGEGYVKHPGTVKTQRGLLLDDSTYDAQSLGDAMKAFDPTDYDSEHMVERAQDFTTQKFVDRMAEAVNELHE